MKLRLVIGVAAALGAIYAAAPSPHAHVQASPICEGVSTTGTLVGNHNVGPFCVPYGFQVNCRTTTVGLDPTVLVTDYTCVPTLAT